MSRGASAFLDISDDDEDVSHQSDIAEDSRFANITGPASKRRKLQHSEDDGSDNSDDEEDITTETIKNTAENLGKLPNSKSNTKTSLKPLTPAQLEASIKKARKTGVVYISRVPPFMKPSALRTFLTPYGTILRIFLTPETTPARKKRTKAGGNKRRLFTDGWVEFASKRRARICAETLNGNTIGGKKSDYYHDDIWNIKYLKGFKWDDLMEQVQAEDRLREGKLQAEIQREARERKAFLGNLELAKKERGKESKRKQREKRKQDMDEQAVPDNTEEVSGDLSRADSGQKPFERRFKQNAVKEKARTTRIQEQPEDVRRILSKIF